MAYEHRAALDDQLRSAVPNYKRIDDLLPNHKWVWLIRRDKVLQAISWCRAETSNSWTSVHDGNKAEFTYDFIHIFSRVMLILSSEFAWECYFRDNGIEPFHIIYEDFFRDVDQQLAMLIRYLGGSPGKRGSLDTTGTFNIQRDQKTYDMRQRFVHDLHRLGSDRLTNEIGEPFQKWIRFLFQFGWLR